MEFWIGFSLSILFFLIVEKFFCQAINRRFLAILFLIYIIIVSGFRNNIGLDYNSYVSFFYDSLVYDLKGIEPSFIWLNRYLAYLGLNASAMFFIYAFLNIIFIFKACRYYMENKIFPLSLYILFPFFFWMSLSGIRQALAVSIIFWGSKFLLERKKIRFLLCVCIATMVHFSAFISIFMYFFYKLSLKKSSLFFLVLVSVIIGFSKILADLIDIILNLFDLRYVSYLLADSTVFSGVGFTILLLIWGLVLFFYKNTNDLKEKLVINLYTFGIIIGNLFLFSSPLARLKDYYYIFMIIAIPYALKNFKHKIFIELFICIFGIIYFLYAIFLVPENMGVSNNNIEYEFNMDFFE